jgi:Na+/melibiose symporter-like transporter
MAKLSEGLESALETVVASYSEEYARIANAWKDLETKAAGVTTIAGIFLGFVLNFVKDVHDRASPLQQFLAGVTLLLLLTTLSLAVAAVAVRERVRAPTSAGLYKAAKDLYRLGSTSRIDESAPMVLHDRVHLWDVAVRSRTAENQRKAKYVRWAQFVLLASMFLAAFLALLTLLSRSDGGKSQQVAYAACLEIKERASFGTLVTTT